MKHYCNKCRNRVFKDDLDDKGFCTDCSDDLQWKVRKSIVTRKEVKNRDEYFGILDYLSDEDDKTYDILFLPLIVAIFSPIILYFSTDKFTELSFFGAILFSILASCFFGFCAWFIYALWHGGIKKLWGKFANNFESALTIKILTFLITFLIILIISCVIYFKYND